MRRALAISGMCMLLLVGPTAVRADDRPAPSTRCELAAFPPPRPVEAAPTGWRMMLHQLVRGFERTETPDAALERLGGTRLTMRADAELFRAALLDDLRNDARCLIREARIAHGELAVRDGSVALRLREPAQAPQAIAALAAATGGAADIVDIVDLGDGLLKLTPGQKGFADRLGAVLERSREIIAGRAKDLGIAQAGVARDGADRLRIVLPGVADASRLVAMLGSRARLELRLIDASISAEQALKTTVPPDDDVLYGAKDKFPYLVSRKVAVSGADIIEASATFAGARDEPAVSFRFDARGTRAFADATRENVGRPFAIVLDDAVISAPVIREPILGGSGLINGNFTVREANDLAILLRSGALPLRLDVVERQAVAAAKTN
jgi:preprotein translocase subunit SecD